MSIEKEIFLKSELGLTMESDVRALDFFLERRYEINQFNNPEEFKQNEVDISLLLSRWKVFQMVLKQFYEYEFHFTRTDDYYGVCTEDEKIWLIKSERA